jgi:hypothetical protein
MDQHGRQRRHYGISHGVPMVPARNELPEGKAMPASGFCRRRYSRQSFLTGRKAELPVPNDIKNWCPQRRNHAFD